MAQDIQSFSVTVPAGTPVATPQVTVLTLGLRIVDRIEIRVPPGPRGEVGFFLASAGTQIIPSNLGTFIIEENRELSWDVEGYLDSGAWEVHIYNTGAFAHTLYYRFFCRFTSRAQRGLGQQPLAADQLAPDASSLGSALPALPPLPPLPVLPALPPPPGLSLPGPSGFPGSTIAPKRYGESQEDNMVTFEFQNQLHVVEVDVNGNMQHRYFTGQWQKDQPLTGLVPQSRVAYDIGYQNQLHLFADRPDGSLAHAFYGNGAWSTEVIA